MVITVRKMGFWCICVYCPPFDCMCVYVRVCVLTLQALPPCGSESVWAFPPPLCPRGRASVSVMHFQPLQTPLPSVLLLCHCLQHFPVPAVIKNTHQHKSVGYNKTHSDPDKSCKDTHTQVEHSRASTGQNEIHRLSFLSSTQSRGSPSLTYPPAHSPSVTSTHSPHSYTNYSDKSLFRPFSSASLYFQKASP